MPAVEFEMEINVQTSTRGNFRTFLMRLRARLGVRSSHNRPALAVQEKSPTRFFDLIIQTNDHSVRFRLRMDNLYLIGYRMENGQWLEFDNDDHLHLIQEPGTTFLGFDGNYSTLANIAGLNIQQIRVGFYNLGYGINQLATSTTWGTRALYLVVVIMMFCESTRLIPIFDHMVASFDNSYGTNSYDYDNFNNRNREGQIQPWMTDLVHAWDPFSAALLRADAYPGESYQLRRNVVRLPPHNREIRTIAQAAEILGILLGLCFTRSSGRPRRMTFDNEGKCFVGLPLVQVFSVSIDNIDDEDLGKLYGTITVEDGLNIEYLYNRTKSSPESIKPGQNASLTGPSQSILAISNFTIKFLLTDKDTLSPDDEIINKAFSWNAYENIRYNKSLTEKIDGKRGSATLNYAVLRNAVAARITITLEEAGERTADVYGKVEAHYDNWEDPNATCLLFNRSSSDYIDVRRWQYIPLLRSVVAVPLNGSLIITASLYDHDTLSSDDEIAKGTVEFPAKMSGTSHEQIRGEDGNWVSVTVYWTCDI